MHKHRRLMLILSIVYCVLLLLFPTYSREIKTENEKFEALVVLKILEDTSNMDKCMTRAEFCKVIIKASSFKDKVAEYITEDVCTDVKSITPYAPYIKKALEEAYIFTYLGGKLKPNDYVTFNDLSRACLALLSYTNDDFRGNQVKGRNIKFKLLGLNENIDKDDNEVLTKRDIANGIYNMLNENIKDSNTLYGKKVFEDLIIGSDKEINVSEYKKNEIDGPIIINSISDIDIKDNIYINGVKSNVEELKLDIVDYGYAICYIDNDNKIVYAYTERHDILSPVILKKGYINGIYYSASNMLIPYRVDIDSYKYYLESEEAKFQFSANGDFKVEDYIVYLCNKMNDISNAYLNEDGTITYNNDEEEEPYNGSIIIAFHYNLIKK